jgi:hypothetical protein
MYGMPSDIRFWRQKEFEESDTRREDRKTFGERA